MENSNLEIFNGMIKQIEYNPEANNIILNCECTMNEINKYGKLTDCNFTIEKNLNIDGKTVNNPVIVNNDENNIIVNFIVSTKINGKQKYVFISFKSAFIFKNLTSNKKYLEVLSHKKFNNLIYSFSC